ncbi:hypothetical protein [Pyrobaculum calidifontis]|uniref:Uncharacterized protein n=1 Tax=Pyrobaculum calidifontis (strain DSM 21063 / JCM 11548 / VA1) TaxID=410359 RepID=A3MX68_PYRCJ|nr:hypothetical protein [Pyrobaculum calidifontis]ABO09235.1 conserved hypothetical protein [Pyrobaculum calidifontis JCM 11548]
MIYPAVLAFLLAYNNSLVLLGPTAWGSGAGPRRSFAIALAGQMLGMATSNLQPLKIGTAEFFYISALYVALTAAKISLPVAVVTYAIHRPSLDAALFWLLSPAVALSAYAYEAVGGRYTTLLTLFAVMYAFGYNNLALFAENYALTAVAAAAGTYLGLSYSRWVLDLAALRSKVANSVNLAAATAAALGTALGIPISFTLVAYSALLVTSLRHRIRVIKVEKFVKAYLSIAVAVVAAAIFPALRQLLQLQAPQAT